MSLIVAAPQACLHKAAELGDWPKQSAVWRTIDEEWAERRVPGMRRAEELPIDQEPPHDAQQAPRPDVAGGYVQIPDISRGEARVPHRQHVQDVLAHIVGVPLPREVLHH